MNVTVSFEDDTVVVLNTLAGNRVLYAITTLAQTPVMAKLPIRDIKDGRGVILWPPKDG